MAHTDGSIWKGIRRIALAGSALTLMWGALNTAALADDARIREATFDVSSFPTTIRVSSSDGRRWDKIEPGPVVFSAHTRIDTRYPGYVDTVGMFLGHCEGSQCGNGYPLVFYDSVSVRDYEKQGEVSFSASKIPVSGPGIALVPYGDQILSSCNAHLDRDGATTQHSFSLPMDVSMSANTQSAVSPPPPEVETGQPVFGGGDVTRHGNFSVNVVCKPYPRSVNDVTAQTPQTFQVGNIDLFQSTYVGVTSEPDRATVCKKARVLVRLETNKPGAVKFKLWNKIGDGPTGGKVVDAWASHDGNGHFKAEYAEWVEVTKSTVVQSMAEDMTNPIGQSTGWKDIMLTCTGAGGGGLADAPHPDNDGPVPLKVTGELTLADQAGVPKDRPRLGQAVFKIWANKPGNTAYELTCTGGRQWSGSLPTFEVGAHKYQAVGAQNFNIDKTEQIGCVLRSTSLPKHDVIAVASELFEVIKRNPDVAGPGRVTLPPPLPTHSAPQRLVGTVGQTPPTISCIGGISTGTTCFCRPPTVKVQTGPNSYRCVMDGLKTGAAPQRLVGPANSTPPTISCIGGISTGTTCFCRPPTEKVQTGPNSYRCVMGGLSTGAGHGGPFVNRFDNRPRIMVGPAPAQGSQPPFARPMFNRQSALPPHGMIR